MKIQSLVILLISYSLAIAGTNIEKKSNTNDVSADKSINFTINNKTDKPG
ncbi:MAG: hypothetical protein K0R14_717 [Burkholderiales bacterium]|jgi:thioredoxin-related protein|nr:hypothetical protein [Burkholderiales bacterium]